MHHQSEQTDEKREYQPPRLTTISLRPEEAVLGHCKIAGGSGPSAGFGPCDVVILGCKSIGS